MALPTTKSQKETSLNKQVMLIYGRAGLGKSTLCSYFDGAIFFATEPLNSLEVFKENINSWEKFLEKCGEMAQGNHQFKTIIIDTIDNLIFYCTDYICRENKVDHPGDLPNGKGWTLVTNELNRALSKLYSLGYGVVLVGHVKLEEMETKTKKYTRFTINAGGQNRFVILNRMEIVLFMDSEIKDGAECGVIRTKPSLYWEAKDKIKLLPDNIYYPLNDPQIAFNTIQKCFNENVING